MTTSLQPNGKYLVEPDKRRGELHVVYVSGATGGASGGGRIKLEWKDRRTKVRCKCFCVLYCVVCVCIVRRTYTNWPLNLYLLSYLLQHTQYQQQTITISNNIDGSKHN